MRTPSTQHVSCGELSFGLEADRLTCVCWQGVEIIRAISAPVRDTDWGTIGEKNVAFDVSSETERVTIARRFVVGDDLADGTLLATADPNGLLRVDWSLTPRRDLTINRAGLSVLHPLKGVEGTDLLVTGVDGTNTAASFPKTIAPSQPATGFVALEHTVSGVAVHLAFDGETFEMEDQRNWSDASYKTYCRPLAAPRPFLMRADETVTQRLEASFRGHPTHARAADTNVWQAQMPEILLAAEPDWLTGALPAGTAYLARLSDSVWSDNALATLAPAPVDIEIVVPDDADPDVVLCTWADRLKAAGVSPRHAVALPAAYLTSYQPEGPWPAGVTPEACLEAAQRAFPQARIGAGMLTNFTEFNRHPPAKDLGDYITHANSAIVHAADNLSVLQTLEAMPAIFQSARRLGGDRAYRLGLCSVAMRSNPYGSGLQPNPGLGLQTMTDTDPRQGTAFAAAYALGLVSLAAANGAQAICLGAMAGPFSIAGPLGDMIGHIGKLAGKSVRLEARGGHFTLSVEDLILASNCGLETWHEAPGGALDSASWRVLPSTRASA